MAELKSLVWGMKIGFLPGQTLETHKGLFKSLATYQPFTNSYGTIRIWLN